MTDEGNASWVVGTLNKTLVAIQFDKLISGMVMNGEQATALANTILEAVKGLDKKGKH